MAPPQTKRLSPGPKHARRHRVPHGAQQRPEIGGLRHEPAVPRRGADARFRQRRHQRAQPSLFRDGRPNRRTRTPRCACAPREPPPADSAPSPPFPGRRHAKARSWRAPAERRPEYRPPNAPRRSIRNPGSPATPAPPGFRAGLRRSPFTGTITVAGGRGPSGSRESARRRTPRGAARRAGTAAPATPRARRRTSTRTSGQPASLNSANSLSAGLAEACVTRSRSRCAMTGASRRISRRAPMPVAFASGCQPSGCQRSISTGIDALPELDRLAQADHLELRGARQIDA